MSGLIDVVCVYSICKIRVYIYTYIVGSCVVASSPQTLPRLTNTGFTLLAWKYSRNGMEVDVKVEVEVEVDMDMDMGVAVCYYMYSNSYIYMYIVRDK